MGMKRPTGKAPIARNTIAASSVTAAIAIQSAARMDKCSATRSSLVAGGATPGLGATPICFPHAPQNVCPATIAEPHASQNIGAFQELVGAKNCPMWRNFS